MSKEKNDTDIRLAKGSLYRLTTLGTRDANMITQGTFLGFTSIGSDEGICLSMDKTHGDLKDKVRVIPTHVILAIDLIDQKEEEKTNLETERTAHYFG